MRRWNEFDNLCLSAGYLRRHDKAIVERKYVILLYKQKKERNVIMTRKKKQVKSIGLMFMLIMFGLICTCNTVRAEDMSGGQEPNIVVQRYFETMGKSWDEFAELYTENQVEGLKTFLKDNDNIKENVGVLNVIDASLNEVVEVSYSDVKDMLSEDYTGKNVKIFVVGAEFQVKKDNMYFSDGTIYNFLILEKENEGWKVNALNQIADPKLLKVLGYSFKSDYVATENMMEARQNGYLLNGEGEVYANITGNSVNNEVSTCAILNKRTVPTDETKIAYGTYKNGVFQKRKTIKFHDYCLGVSAGEVRGKEFDGTARKAVNIAIKTYTWHYKIVPIDPVHSVDIKNTMQAYKPSKVSENKKVTSDYNAVKNIWMESYKGNIFAAGYGAGKYNDTGEHGGRLMQNGCRYLVKKKNYSFYKCLHYYYDYSDAGSTGGPLRFFDSKKNDLGK